MAIRLLPLDCPRCGSALHGDNRDILFLCAHCGSGAVLTSQGLEVLETTAMLPAPGRRAELWRPAWVIEATVEVTQRVRARGSRTPDSSADRKFVIPAFPLPLGDLTKLVQKLSLVAGVVGEVPHEPVRGGTMRLDDALTLIRHAVVGEEVRRPDDLATVTVTVTERNHRLAALPFERTGDDRLRCAVTGVTVRTGEAG